MISLALVLVSCVSMRKNALARPPATTAPVTSGVRTGSPAGLRIEQNPLALQSHHRGNTALRRFPYAVEKKSSAQVICQPAKANYVFRL